MNIGSIGNSFRGGLAWAAALCAALILTYFLVGVLLKGTEAVTPLAADLREAAALRTFSNELVATTREFLEHQPSGGVVESAAHERWLVRNFRPRINDLRYRLIQADLSGPAHTALLAAADRSAAMAGYPSDARARRAAVDAALYAAVQTETRIRQLGADGRIGAPVNIPSFPKD